ncbi:hypothetical protein ANCCAN_06476 [Ancylostoma caninum]|uniref:Uncharacterized protein n=1 Tax=Ancylostoma caninum TaxID=29170 RepID=A0A368GWN9_ANCCA|nr:hypothetical protein ANCCAN_06476 [Ancylostoma caninum]
MIPIKVLKAQAKPVNPMKYSMEVLYGESTCLKGGLLERAMVAEDCRLKQGGTKALYEVVWHNGNKRLHAMIAVKKIRDIAVGKGI